MTKKRRKWDRPTSEIKKGDLKPQKLSEIFELELDMEPEPVQIQNFENESELEH